MATQVRTYQLSIPPQSHTLARQAIINGNFDVWQRGTSFTNPANTDYTADRFRSTFANTGTLPTNIIHSRQSITPGDLLGSFYHYRIAPNGAGSGFGVNDLYELQHLIENGTRFLCGSGKQVTLSFYARSSIGSKKLGVRLAQTYGTGGSPTAAEAINGTFWTLTSNWTKYSHTFTTNTIVGKTFGTNNDDFITAGFAVMWGSTRATQFGDTVAESFVGSGNIDIAQVQLSAGNEALPFEPKSFGQELHDCQRYYQKTYPYATALGTSDTTPWFFIDGTSGGCTLSRTFHRRMRVAPTVVTYDTAGNSSRISTKSAYAGAFNTNVVPGGVLVEEGSVTISTGAGAITGIGCHFTAEAEL